MIYHACEVSIFSGVFVLPFLFPEEISVVAAEIGTILRNHIQSCELTKFAF